MIVAASDWVERFASDIAIVAAVITGLSLILVKTRLGKVVAWVWKRLVTQPVGTWLEALIERVFNRLIQPFSDRSNNQHIDMAERFDLVEGRIASVQANVDYLAKRSVTHDTQLAELPRITEALGKLEETIAASNDKLTIPHTRSPK